MNHNKIAELIENLDNLSDEEFRSQLKHITSHTVYARENFNSMLNVAIENVYNYLKDISDYQLAKTVEDWRAKPDAYSDTVFKAIKNGNEIRIVVRPSNQNKIIFYYEEELEADDTNYELWTDDGKCNTRMITLGDILKTTGINVIPLRSIYIK